MNFTDELSLVLIDLCNLALKQYDPCHRDGNSGCLRGNPSPCCRGRIWNLEWRENGKCKYLTARGCSNANLKCKSWVCKSALETIDPECFDLLKKVEEIGKEHGLIGRPYLGERHTTS